MYRWIPFSLTSICKVSRVIMPSVSGSSSSLMVAVDWAGTHLKHQCEVLPFVYSQFETILQKMMHYPSGTLLCSHRWVHPSPEVGMKSAIGVNCSLREVNLAPASPFCFSFSDTVGTELSLCIALLCLSLLAFPASSEKPTNGLIGDVGEEFKDTTDGGGKGGWSKNCHS